MNNLNRMPVSVMADFYKITHRNFYPKDTTKIYSTWIPRSFKHSPTETEYAVHFGLQAFIKRYLMDEFQKNFFDRPKEDVIREYEYVIKNTLGGEVDSSHIAELHDLGFLPIKIKALPEGTRVPVKVPSITIENTKPNFYWLTNYLETIMSSELWLPSTTATTASCYRKLLNDYADITMGSHDGVGVEFSGHDFSFRGMSGMNSAMISGMGHLLSFSGSDNIPAIVGVEMYYNTKLSDRLIGTSIPATEHSIMSAYGRDELESFSKILDTTPSGLLSVVSDTYDFWNVVQNVLPKLKDKIMLRQGKLVIRPDSGNPVDIICGDLNCDLDYTSEWSRENCETFDCMYIQEDIKDIVYDKAKDDCEGAGVCGDDYYYVTYKFHDGNYYKAEATVFYNRYDKQYYYPEEITCKIEKIDLTPENKGVIECLWDIFGGTKSDTGYKLLDEHIGLIYGDAITYSRCKDICEKLKKKGFATTNVVFGIGSYTYQHVTRDSMGYALKATYAIVGGEEKFIEKDPKTDIGNLKKSLTGKVAVIEQDGKLVAKDKLTEKDEADMTDKNLLETIYEDGLLLVDCTFDQVSDRLNGGI